MGHGAFFRRRVSFIVNRTLEGFQEVQAKYYLGGTKNCYQSTSSRRLGLKNTWAESEAKPAKNGDGSSL